MIQLIKKLNKYKSSSPGNVFAYALNRDRYVNQTKKKIKIKYLKKIEYLK